MKVNPSPSPIRDLGHIKYIECDGGRKEYIKRHGSKGRSDCAVRAISTATGISYEEVLNELWKRQTKSPQRGTEVQASNSYMDSLGYEYTECRNQGVTLRSRNLPKTGTYVLRVSHHLTCYIDGVLYDNHDCTKNGRRRVKGFWKIA